MNKISSRPWRWDGWRGAALLAAVIIGPLGLIWLLFLSEISAATLVNAAGLLLASAVVIAFLAWPYLHARYCRHPQSSAIAALNLLSLLGAAVLYQIPHVAAVLAVIGWIAAMVWAHTATRTGT